MFNSKHRTFIRSQFGLRNNTNIPVNIVYGYQAPKLTGRSGGWFTRGGTRISSPGAYSRKGWSNMMYLCDLRQINVGCFWLLENYNET